MTDVQLRDISKKFGALKVVDAITLDIASGEFVALIGPSGCGKSTLLRMLAGLESITDGELTIGGLRANDLAPQKRDIAMVFQSYALFPHMRVGENIGFGPRIRGDGIYKIAAKVNKAADILDLFNCIERYPRQLSGGQRQRVAMGRAIVREPKLFLFDEPLSNLDAQLRVQMRTEIKSLHQRLGSTSVYVTHDQIEAMTMADRIIVMREGRSLQIGPPLELYDRPANTFVAGFIGSPAMNFFKGTLAQRENGLAVELPGGLRLDVGARRGASLGHAVEAGVRPEHVRIGQGGASLPMRVDVVEPTGAETQVYGRVGEARIRAVFHDRLAVKPGEELPIWIEPSRVHLFDQATGVRL